MCFIVLYWLLRDIIPPFVLFFLVCSDLTDAQHEALLCITLHKDL